MPSELATPRTRAHATMSEKGEDLGAKCDILSPEHLLDAFLQQVMPSVCGQGPLLLRTWSIEAVKTDAAETKANADGRR